MPPRSGGQQLTHPQEFSRGWALIRARLAALRRAESPRGARELYQAILGLLPLLAEVERAHDPCASAGLSGLPSALHIASDAAALAVDVTSGTISRAFSPEQQRIMVRTMIRILLAFIPPHLDEDNKEAQADQLLALFTPHTVIDDICTLLQVDSRWGFLTTPPDSNGLSTETEDTLMLVALLARLKTLSIEVTAVDQALGKNGPMHRRGLKSTPERMLAACMMKSFDRSEAGPRYLTLSGLAMSTARLGATQLGIDLPDTVYMMGSCKKEEAQPNELAFHPSPALLAARGAWAGPRDLLRRSVLLLSYWPLAEHWNFLADQGQNWSTLAVLVSAAHACQPAEVCEDDRKAQGIAEWKVAVEPSEGVGMVEPAEVLPLIHGLHHTFLRHGCVEGPERNKFDCSVIMVAVSLGILLQLSVTQSAPLKALVKATNVPRSQLSITTHSTDPSGIGSLIAACDEFHWPYAAVVGSEECVKPKTLRIIDRYNWVHDRCQRLREGFGIGIADEQAGLPREVQQQLEEGYEQCQQLMKQLEQVPYQVAWARDWLDASGAAARALFLLLHPLLGCRQGSHGSRLIMDMTWQPVGDDRLSSISSLLIPLTMSSLTLAIPSPEDIKQGSPGAITFSAAAASLGLLMHYALPQLEPGQNPVHGERIARCHTSLNLPWVVQLLPVVKGLSPMLHQKRDGQGGGPGIESSSIGDSSREATGTPLEGSMGSQAHQPRDSTASAAAQQAADAERGSCSSGEQPAPGAAPAAELLLLIASLYLPLALIRTAEVAAEESMDIPLATGVGEATASAAGVVNAGDSELPASQAQAAAAAAVPEPDSSNGTTGATSASLVRDAIIGHLITLLELACTALCVLSELVGDAQSRKAAQEKEAVLLMEALRAGIELLVRSTLLDHLSCPESTAYSSRYCLPGICQQLWADHVTLLSGPQFFGRIYKPFSWGPTGKEYAQAVGGRAHDCFLSFMAALDTDASKGREMKKDSKEGAGDDACSLPYAPRCVTGSLVNQRRLLASWVLKMPPPGDLLQAMESSSFPETFSYQAQTELQVQLPLMALALLRQGGPATGFTEDTLSAVQGLLVVNGATLQGPGPWSSPSPLAEPGTERDKAVRGHLCLAMQCATHRSGFLHAINALRCKESDLWRCYPPQDAPDVGQPPVVVSLVGTDEELQAVLKAQQPAVPERKSRRAVAGSGKSDAGASGSQASQTAPITIPPAVNKVIQASIRAGKLPSAMKAGFRDSGKILTPHREAMLLKMLGEWAKEGVQEEAEQQKEKGPCPAAEGPQEQAQEGVQEGVEQQQGQELKQRRDKAQAATHELEQESQPLSDLMTPVANVESPEHQAFLSWMHGELCGVLKEVLSYEPVKTA